MLPSTSDLKFSLKITIMLSLVLLSMIEPDNLKMDAILNINMISFMPVWDLGTEIPYTFKTIFLK